MTTPTFEHLSTPDLKKRARFTTFALRTAWIGSAIAVASAVFVYFNSGVFYSTMFFFAIVALIASIPVFREREVIWQELEMRKY